ncbi:hypothetical protein M9979_04665 [Sphingomonas sp. RP10(2022)]|uniref:Uncharacterized protein n=1 Tax=Sphingomonas liriopis TaxID=2949094 RepID=A0A9X2KNZ5_9SPHN|nr:hypothetical protein [Sphingomonas liriopis]
MQIDHKAGGFPTETVAPAPDIAGLQPLKTIKSRWPAIIGGLVTLAMLAGLAHELLNAGLAGLERATPRDPWFYVAFAALYFIPPVADYLIFRRLWGIPLAGLVALIKKRIANDVVMGYSGEAYFYAWARQRAQLVAAPFGAVKDVSILSAIAGNAVTLAMIAVALPVGRDLIPPDMIRYVYGSLAVIFGTSLPFLIFSRKVFSLPRGQLWMVFGIHCARLILGALFLAVAWALAMPSVALGTWVFLSAGRMLFGRLPLLPNKDLLFANFAILMIGEDQALSELIAFTAAAVLLVHAVLILGFGLHHLATRKRV